MALTLTVLGCCGTYAGPDGACSGYLLRGAGTTLWLDAGPGTLANLQRHADLRSVDAIVLSHEHPDHWTDLLLYRNVLRYVVFHEGVHVYAPRGLAERAQEELEPPFVWHEVGDGDEVRAGGLALRFSRTDHPVETLAVRVEGEGRAVAYSADTGPGWTFEALGPGLDLAMCEATLSKDLEGAVQHLSARQAAAAARAGGAARLLLTHLIPGADAAVWQAEAEEAFGGGPVDVARHHATYEV
jgi:ribonuclease BN (tRNA processing enzyme)